MKHRATGKFGACYNALSGDVRDLAQRNFELLKQNPSHPSLHFKKVGRFWSVRIGLNHRALAINNDGVFIWHWIGSHADYDALLK